MTRFVSVDFQGNRSLGAWKISLCCVLRHESSWLALQMIFQVTTNPAKCAKVHLSECRRILTATITTNRTSESGYPGVETGEAWNIYSAADENDNRETATSQQWLLCPGQVMNFQVSRSKIVNSAIIYVRKIA